MSSYSEHELDALERELAPTFKQSMAPADPWRESRLEALAASVPKAGGRSRSVWWKPVALFAGAAAIAAISLWVVLPAFAPTPAGHVNGVANEETDSGGLGDAQLASAQDDALGQPSAVQADSPADRLASESAESALGLGQDSLLEDEYMSVASFSLLAALETEVEPGTEDELYDYLLAGDDEEDDEGW